MAVVNGIVLKILLIIAFYITFVMTEEFVFYGMHMDDTTSIRKSIDNSLEIYRRDLSRAMYRMDSMLRAADEWDSTLHNIFAEVHSEWRNVSLLTPNLHEKNEILATDLLFVNTPRLTLGLLNQASTSYFTLHPPNVSSSYTSIQQLLIHLSRDWGDLGEIARKETYIDGVLAALASNTHHLTSSPFHNSSAARVLVPGAGMGRLAVEIAATGFNVEANECSGQMVYAMHAMLTRILPAYATGKGDSGNKNNAFYPFLHFDLMDEWDFCKRMQPSHFPTKDADTILKWIQSRQSSGEDTQDELERGKNISSRGSITIQYGDFLSAYGVDYAKDSFDVVVTCFFIDTFNDIIEPLLVIQHVLRPGGLWLNAGPLHYHGNSKVPYSYVQLERIITSLRFSKVYSRTVRSDYCGDNYNFMKPQIYNFPLAVWRKEDGGPSSTSTSSADQRESLNENLLATMLVKRSKEKTSVNENEKLELRQNSGEDKKFILAL